MRSSFCHDHNAVQWELSETPQALPRPRRELERASRRNTSIPLLHCEQHLARENICHTISRPLKYVFSSFGCHSIRHIWKRISRVYCCEIRLTYRVTCFNHTFHRIQFKRGTLALDVPGFALKENSILWKSKTKTEFYAVQLSIIVSFLITKFSSDKNTF